MLNLIVAGVLGIPLFVVAIGVAPVIALLAVPPLLVLIFRNDDDEDRGSFLLPNQVIITGGSSGIGLSIAKECVQRGVPKITLMARNMEKLQEAKNELLETDGANSDNNNNNKNKTQIEVVSVSVSDYEAVAKVAREMKISSTDRVVLWNCAGFAYPTEFEKVPLAKFEEQVLTNQLGAMYMVRAFLPYLTKGCIVLTSSAAGQLGVYGLTTYAPTKFALRGFAETLHAELIHSHPKLAIQVAFPVDTNTPGYQEESKLAPEITKKLSESGGLVEPEVTAKAMVNAAFCRNPKFSVYFTLEGWMLTNLTAGMSPVSNLSDAVVQVALSGIFRIIGLFILNDWWNIIRSYRKTATPAPAATPANKNKGE